MSFLRLFRSPQYSEEDIRQEKECLARIKAAVSERTGIAEFIHWDDFTVAFAGSRENMELLLEIRTCKYEGKKYLYASVDDEVSWQEWDHNSIAEFENGIIDYIANRVNRTVKTVTEVGKDLYRVRSYYLEDNGQWVCFEDHSSDSKWFCRILSRLGESTEVIKAYRLLA